MFGPGASRCPALRPSDAMQTPETVDDRRLPSPYTPESAPLAPAASGEVATIPPAGLPTDAPHADGERSVGFTERNIPAEVSAAWELELLIAGAVTFALFQLPSALDAGLTWLEPRVSGVPMLVA